MAVKLITNNRKIGKTVYLKVYKKETPGGRLSQFTVYGFLISLEVAIKHTDLFATDVAHTVKVVRLEQISLFF